MTPSCPSRLWSPLLWLTLAALALFSAAPSRADKLSLDAYLEQVRTGNGSFKAAEKSKEGGTLRSGEGELQTAWTLVAGGTVVGDWKLPMSAATPYDAMWNQSYQAGISKMWSFGLLTKLTYNMVGTSYVNATTQTFGGFILGALPSFNTYPMLEVSLPLLANGFGSTVRAAQDLTEAAALASSYGASFQGKVLASSAEATYWRLSVARRLHALSKETLERTQKIHDWNARRVKMSLADRSELLQTSAGLQAAKLSVRSAADEERNATRAFNGARGFESLEAPEELEAFDAAIIDKLAIPERATLRDDVKAAEQSMRISQANARIAIEKDWPTLDLFSNVAINGQRNLPYPASFSESIAATNPSRPTFTVGLRLNMPLYFLTAADSREGWRKESIAADLSYTRKLFEQEQAWQELTQHFGDAKERLEIARELERIQREKLDHERTRYDRGRTTTFQLLSFENDYLTSQLSRIRSEFDVISTVAQLKLFAKDAAPSQP